METTPGASIFLGLRGDADIGRVREAAERAEQGVELDASRYVRDARGRAASPLPDPCGHGACERGRQRRARDQRDAVPLHAPLLRLAAAGPGRAAASRARRPRVREPRPATQRRRDRGPRSRAADAPQRERLGGARARPPSGSLLPGSTASTSRTRSTMRRTAGSTSSTSSPAPRSRSRPARATRTALVRGDDRRAGGGRPLRATRVQGPPCKLVKALVP